MQENTPTLGHVLTEEALEREGWTRQRLEEEIGASKGWASRCLNEFRMPDLAFLGSIRDRLGVPVDAWTRPALKSFLGARRNSTRSVA